MKRFWFVCVLRPFLMVRRCWMECIIGIENMVNVALDVWHTRERMCERCGCVTFGRKRVNGQWVDICDRCMFDEYMHTW